MDEFNITPLFLFKKYTRKERKEQLQRCARAYHADMLRSEGFVSYKGEDLSWYRVINHEVLQSVHLFFDSLRWPSLRMGYAAHPLYMIPWVPLGITPKRTVPWGDEIMLEDLYPHSECIFSKDTPISCPRTEKNGAERLTDVVFPILREIHTARDAYLFHKQRFLKQVTEEYQRYGEKSLEGAMHISAELGDEVVYFEDEEMYSVCLKCARNRLKTYEKDFANGIQIESLNEYEKRYFNSSRLHIAAIEDGKREEFLQEMNLRRNQTIKKLKRAGIEV